MNSVPKLLDRNMPILVVDDYSTVRRIVRHCLRQLGFENVTEAEDGMAALEKLQKESFSLIISDWNMPNLMGLELLKAVRSSAALKDIPFLMVIAEKQKNPLLEALPADRATFIVKPFTAELLRQRMEALFPEKEKSS